MNLKKFVLVGLAVGALAFATAPQAEARISVDIGIGLPFGYYPAAYYPYGYDYYGYRPRYRARRVVYVAPRYYWHHGRRIYYPRRHHSRHWR